MSPRNDRMNPELHIAGRLPELYADVATRVQKVIHTAIGRDGRCSVVLAGGGTPLGLYRLLGAEPYRSTIPWGKVHLFFGDERMVPPQDPDSNYGMVARELLAHLSIPAGNIHRIAGESDPRTAARSYEHDLKVWCGSDSPRFDLVLLGVGEDGHTASLFPGTAVLGESKRLVAEVFEPRSGKWRVSLTLPLLNNAREIWFLVAGIGKADVVRTVLHAGDPDPRIPATCIRPGNGPVSWFLDREAASRLG